MDLQKLLTKAKQTGVLSLRDQNLPSLPSEIYDAETISAGVSFYEAMPIKRLEIVNSQLKAIESAELEKLENLEALILQKNLIQIFAPAELPSLKLLDLSANKLTSFPDISGFGQLKIVVLSSNPIKTLEISSDSIVTLELNACALSTLTVDCPSLIDLQIDANKLTSLDLQNLTKLTKLSAKRNLLHRLTNYEGCANLASVDLEMNRFSSTPLSCELFSNIQLLYNLISINLNNNQLRSTPENLFLAQNLQIFQANDNEISNILLPKGCFWTASKLEILSLSCNNLQEIPGEIGLLNNLKRLILVGNPMRKMSRISQEASVLKAKEFLVSKLPLDHAIYKKEVELDEKNNDKNIQLQINNTQLDTMTNSGVKLIFCNQKLPGSLFTSNVENIVLLKLEKIIGFNQDTMDTFCEHLGRFSQLKELVLRGISDIPEIILASVPNLQKVDLSQMRNLQFFQCADMPQLQYLTVQQCILEDFVMDRIENLVYLDIQQNKLSIVPPSVYKQENIQFLDVSQNQIKAVSKQVFRLRKLQNLNLGQNSIQYLPSELGLLGPAVEHSDARTKLFAGRLQQVGVQGNYLVRPSKAVAGRGTKAILQYLREVLDFELFIEELNL